MEGECRNCWREHKSEGTAYQDLASHAIRNRAKLEDMCTL